MGEKSIDQLQCLVEAISSIGIISQDKWVAQKNNTIPKTHGQSRVKNKDTRTHNTQDLLQKNGGATTTTTKPQKIVVSTADPPVVTLPSKADFISSLPSAPSSLPSFITQEEEPITPSYDRQANNTRAKKLTWTLMQDFCS